MVGVLNGGRTHWEAFPEAAGAPWTGGRLSSQELRGLTEMNQSLGPFISLETETSLGSLGWMNWTECTLCSASDFSEKENTAPGAWLNNILSLLTTHPPHPSQYPA